MTLMGDKRSQKQAAGRWTRTGGVWETVMDGDADILYSTQKRTVEVGVIGERKGGGAGYK